MCCLFGLYCRGEGVEVDLSAILEIAGAGGRGTRPEVEVVRVGQAVLSGGRCGSCFAKYQNVVRGREGCVLLLPDEANTNACSP